MLNKSEIAILTIAVSIGSQNYFKMKQCRHFMQITYSPNNVLITMSCRLRGGCERLHKPVVDRIARSSPASGPSTEWGSSSHSHFGPGTGFEELSEAGAEFTVEDGALEQEIGPASRPAHVL